MFGYCEICAKHKKVDTVNSIQVCKNCEKFTDDRLIDL